MNVWLNAQEMSLALHQTVPALLFDPLAILAGITPAGVPSSCE